MFDPKKDPHDELLRELDEVLPTVEWKTVATPPGHGAEKYDAVFWEAHHPPWNMSLVDFDIEEQGFPKGSRGQDGAAMNSEKLTLVRMTREMAEKAVVRAKTQALRKLFDELTNRIKKI